MAWYYSASERAFFSSDLMTTGSMPADKVAVTDSDYEDLMDDQVNGLLIRPGSGNAPESASQNLTRASRFGDVSFGKVTATGLDLNGNADVSGTLVVTGASTLKGALAAQGGLTTTTITATGTSTLAAVNATNITASGTLKVNGASTLKAVSATNITASGTLAVTGTSTFTGKVTANGGLTTKALTATSLDLNGAGDISGNLSVGGLLTVTGSGTLGSLTVNGSTSLGDSLTVDGDIQGYWYLSKPNSSGPFFRAQFPDAERGTAPASTKWMHISVYDKNGLTNGTNRFGAINFKLDTDGTNGIQLVPYQNIAGSSAKTAAFGIYISQDGTARVEGPTPPATASGSVIPNLTWLDAYSPTLSRNGVKVVVAPDYNTLTAPGFYHCNSTNQQNGPGGANKLIVMGSSPAEGKYVSQLSLPVGTGICPAYRIMDGNGAWQPWQKILLSESDEDISAKSLSITGDAMTAFNGTTSSVVPNYAFTINGFSKGNNPAQAVTARYFLYDADNKAKNVGALAGLLLGVDTNGRTSARLLAFQNASGSSAQESIDIYANADGTYSTSAPEPVETADSDQIATAHWTRQHGGSDWGLGRSAIPMSSTEYSDGDVNTIRKCGFYGLSSATNALWATSILLHIQRPWTAGPGAFQFNFATDGDFAVRTFNNSETWSNWRKVAHQDWVLSQLSTSIPAGAIMYFAQSNVPDGWLFCNGSNVSRTTYANLFAAIGTKYGSGNGSSTFTLPNLRDIFIQGASSTSNVGQSVAAGLPNITGAVTGYDMFRSMQGAGPFFDDTTTNAFGLSRPSGGHSHNDSSAQIAGFDASRATSLYGASSTVQPPAIRLLPCIKV